MTSILPKPVQTKIYKTGQTRGADDDVIYQNRVGRNSTVLIPFVEFEKCRKAPTNHGNYEKGYIVLIKPEDFFDNDIQSSLKSKGLHLGENLLVFYETRHQWDKYPPLKGWGAANSRANPLGGQYVARIPATTSVGEKKIIEGFNSTKMKGAGIRVYEYADTATIRLCKIQLEYLFWLCKDITEMIADNDMDEAQAMHRIKEISTIAQEKGLADKEKLIAQRIIDRDGHTICPLCLKHISAKGFCTKIQQAEGRDVPDLTITEVSLFHIHELRTGEFNHRPYNLGWGHHHCNVVVKDAGIEQTLRWMREVLRRNDAL